MTSFSSHSNEFRKETAVNLITTTRRMMRWFDRYTLEAFNPPRPYRSASGRSSRR
jgi:hypothetical protein